MLLRAIRVLRRCVRCARFLTLALVLTGSPQLASDDAGGAAAPAQALLRTGSLARSPERGRGLGGAGGGTGSLRVPLTPEDVAGAWDSVAALGLPPHVRALLEDAKVAQARPARPWRPRALYTS